MKAALSAMSSDIDMLQSQSLTQCKLRFHPAFSKSGFRKDHDCPCVAKQGPGQLHD